MKLRFLIGLLALLAWACSPVKESTKTSAVVTHDSLDSTEYGIIIIDLYFDQWYLLNYSPAKDRTNEYYQYKNRIAVENWNYFYRTNQYNWIIDCYIDYQPNIDYGMEVNRKLFWYFKYIREEYHIRLI